MSRAVLIALRQARLHRRSYHVRQHRFVPRAGASIGSDIDHLVERQRGEIRAGRMDLRDAQVLERGPVPQRHARIDERHLDRVFQRFLLLVRQLRAQIGNHHIVAGEDAGTRPHSIKLPVAQVSDLDLGCARGIADVARADDRAAQPDAHRRLRTIEARIVHARGNGVLGVIARQASRDEMAHQEPGDRGIAVGKMEGVGAAIGVARGGVSHVRRRAGLEAEALKTGKAERPHVERGNGIDADAPFAVRPRLVEGNNSGIGLDHIQQEVAIAHARQSRFFLVGGEAGQVVDLRLLDFGNIALHRRRQRRAGEALRP